jgi:hypothetical protein
MSLKVLDALLFSFALLGTNILELLKYPLSPGWKSFYVFLIAIFYFILFRMKETRGKHHFAEEGSPEFQQFFSDWYGKQGSLFVFCSHLEWVTGDILSALKLKSSKLTLLIKDPTEPTALVLKTSGANIIRIPEGIHSDHRLSIIEDDGISKIIVRKKDPSLNEVVFIENDDRYLIGLAKDLITSCDSISKGSRV